MKPVDVEIGRSVPGAPTTVEIDLMDVRASDGLRVSYDFERDGWSIQQPRSVMRETGPNRAEQITTWHEVYFAPSWALESEEL
jgi:hypothetical protein